MRSVLTVLCLGLALLAVTALVMTLGVLVPVVQESGVSLQAVMASAKFKTLKVGGLLTLASGAGALILWRILRS
ncbi:hypothetical protein HK107_00970 [Parvularcula sp. ZS-1/3]|uniref:Uncharacterized protein n=1 Tax=Parvularcula mediterranea TaxID=2732508 RepID=A0A7Y3RIV7_9PROT|nr:hypothetical protein [Parvularcula mediterranea]NNU14893.1 hypothetical protein [Parvularcula mediterranea]